MAEIRTEIAVIGSGPAGLTAAVYGVRAGRKVLVVEGMPGGQLMNTTDVENFPGFPDGIPGPELMMRMRQQAERLGAEFHAGLVEKADLGGPPFILEAGGDRILCEAVIIATGAAPRRLGLEAEQRFYGRGVSYCATCDGAFYRGMAVAVVGGGDSAVEEASYLANLASRVHLIHRRDQLRAKGRMAEKVLRNEKIRIEWNSVVADIRGDEQGNVAGVVLRNTRDGSLREIEVAGLFVARAAIGDIPRAARDGREGVYRYGEYEDERDGRVRGRRRAGSPLSPGSDCSGQRMRGRTGGGPLP